jgi:hypothetical protein
MTSILARPKPTAEERVAATHTDLDNGHYGPTDNYGSARIIATAAGIPRMEIIRLLLAGKIKGYQGGRDHWIDLLSLREYQLSQRTTEAL